MKKGTVVIFAIAILGVMAFYKDHGHGAATLVPAASASGSSSSSAVSSKAVSQSAGYKNGTFTGDTAYIPYGPVQVAVVVSGGKITDVNFLQMPSDQGYSRYVAAMAEPLLKQTTLQAQSANIDFVSGATATSSGYQRSLQSALDKAAASSAGQNTNAPASSAPSQPGYTPSNIPGSYDN